MNRNTCFPLLGFRGFPVCLCLWLLTASLLQAAAEPINIALGRPYMWSVPPNYSPCTDPGNAIQLTDGKLVDGYFWAQKGTVGWESYNHVSVTIDLGIVQPIAGVAYHTAAGTAGVKWPRMLYVLVSDDGLAYHPVADLVSLQTAIPPQVGYRTFSYRSDRIKTYGRYVRLLIAPGAGSRYIFCDEIQVFRGADSFLATPHHERAFGDEDSLLTVLGCASRYQMDLHDVEQRLRSSRLARRALADALAECACLVNELEAGLPRVNLTTFRAIIPFSDFHRRIFKLNAQALAADGFDGIVVWNKHRYAPMSLFETPSRQFNGLDVQMIDGEQRAEVLNLTNASDADRIVRLQIRNLPGGINPPWVQVRRVEWWDVQEGKPILDPLVDLTAHNEWFEIDLPAGMTRQVWFAFHPQSLTAETCRGEVLLQSGRIKKSVRLTLTIAPSPVPERPNFDLWMWDYTEGPSSYAVTAGNRLQAIADLKRHGVTTPCAGKDVLPTMDATYFDGTGNLIKPLVYTAFDTWVREWPSAQHFNVFWSVGASFLNFRIGSPEFVRAVGQWARAWEYHNRQIGLRPGQVIFHPVDEPQSEAKYQLYVEWISPFKSGTEEIACFLNPAGDASPWEFKSGTDAIRLADFVCPAINRFMQDKKKLWRSLGDTKSRNKALTFYAACQPGINDPTTCERLLPWIAFTNRATGLGFWSYADAPRKNCWNDYLRLSATYSPVFFDSDAVTGGKHWEAIHEGVEDYENLVSLRIEVNRVLARNSENALAIEAREFINDLDRCVISRILDQYPVGGGQKLWNEDGEPMLLDDARLRALRYMTKLALN